MVASVLGSGPLTVMSPTHSVESVGTLEEMVEPSNDQEEDVPDELPGMESPETEVRRISLPQVFTE